MVQSTTTNPDGETIIVQKCGAATEVMGKEAIELITPREQTIPDQAEWTVSTGMIEAEDGMEESTVLTGMIGVEVGMEELSDPIDPEGLTGRNVLIDLEDPKELNGPTDLENLTELTGLIALDGADEVNSRQAPVFKPGLAFIEGVVVLIYLIKKYKLQQFLNICFVLAIGLTSSFFLHDLAYAQELNPHQQAEEYGRLGKLESMERAYDLLLKKNPADLRARMGRANARSWKGDHNGAQGDYQKILANDPKHLGALTGLAYDYAWSKKYEDAEKTFNKAIEIAPDNLSALKGLGFTYLWSGRRTEALNLFNHLADTHPMDTEIQAAMSQARPKKVPEEPGKDIEDLGALVSLGYERAWAKQYQEAEEIFQRSIRIAPENLGAQKGLGYVYLWSGRHKEALKHFNHLAKAYPEESEIQVAIGQANLGMGHPKSAEESFKNALSIDPLRTDAVQGLRAAYSFPALIELHVWGGNTSGDGDTGLRLVELASWVTPKIRLWGRFDNSLSLDNPALARSGQSAETYFVGVLNQFSENWLGSAEFGYRDLPQGKHQEVYKLSTVYLRENHAVKFGGQISPHSDGFTDELIFAGYDFPIEGGFRLEPTLFYANTGATNDDEWRGILFGHYKSSKGWTLSAGGGGGRINSAIPGAGGSVKVANALLTLPVYGYHSINFSARYENNPNDEFTVVMVGITLRWPRD